MPRLHRELGEDVLPPEAGLVARAVSLAKGCYTGQEIVARLVSRGAASHRLVGAALRRGLSRGRPAAEHPRARRDGDRERHERVSSALAGAIGLGFVRRPATQGRQRGRRWSGVQARVCRAAARRAAARERARPDRLREARREPGRVKTRLCPPLSPAQAAALYAAMLADVLATTAAATAAAQGSSRARGRLRRTPAPSSRALPARRSASSRSAEPTRRAHGKAVADGGRRAGLRPILLRGSDNPALGPALSSRARSTRSTAPTSSSCPDRDGGYGLVALRRPAPGPLRPSDEHRDRARGHARARRAAGLARATARAPLRHRHRRRSGPARRRPGGAARATSARARSPCSTRTRPLAPCRESGSRLPPI